MMTRALAAIGTGFIVFAMSGLAIAQQPSLASSLGLFVYPSNDQSPETQNADEAACYAWAQQTTGTDPIQGAQAAAQQVQAQAPQQGSAAGGAGRGLLRGAARGALIGEIADEDTSDFAWAGAVVGSVRGAQRQQVRNQVSQQVTSAQASEAAAQVKETFNKALSACLEGKGYTVK